MVLKTDDHLIKRAYKRVEYTKKDIGELKACMDPDTGPMFFMENFMFIQHPVRGREQFSPYDFQRDLINVYHRNRKSINMVSRQLGKALSVETPILTPTGFMKMGDLRVGDTIFGRDGKPTKITFITPTMHDHDCYEVEFIHGEKIIADAGHLWKVYDQNLKKEIIMTTEELAVKASVRSAQAQPYYIKHVGCLEFRKAEISIPAYLLGLWLGDGGTMDPRITCSRGDYDTYKKYLMHLDLKISVFRPDKRRPNTGTFNVYGLVTLLKENGLFGNKHIPLNYVFNSKEVRLELLKGLMDSDGSASKEGYCRFYQSDEGLIDQVRHLLSVLGIKSSKTVKRLEKYKDAYSLTFCESIESLFVLERKSERQFLIKNHPKNKRIYFRNIKKVKSVPVRCLQIDSPDHMFLCGNTLIPTHNTTVAAGYLLWYAMFNPDSTILVASNKFDGAMEIMQRVRYCYESLPDHIRAGVLTYNKKSLEFDNDSRIIAATTTSTTGRGMSLSLVYLDEFSFVEQGIAREFWTALSPTLSTGGKCIITSTPDTDEDQFAELWFGANNTVDEYGNENKDGLGVNGFRPYYADWTAHPERDEEWAREQRADLGDERFDREHLCKFVSFEETLLNFARLANLKSIDPIRKSGEIRWFKEINKNCTYVVSLDPSMGTGGDNSAIQVFELPTLCQTAEWQHNRTPVEGQISVLMDILKELEDAGVTELYWSVENNTLGEAALVVIRDTGEDFFPGTMLNEPRSTAAVRRKGFTTTNRSKLEACSKLKRFIESERMTIYSKNLISELKTYVRRANTYEARPGNTDDLVAAVLLFIRMASFISVWDSSSHTAMNSSIEVDSPDETPLPMIII